MKRVHRVIYHEITPPSLIALMVLTFVVFTREFGRVSQLFIQQRAEASLVFELIATILPQILIYTVPISFLIGTLVGFSRLSSDSEVVALRSGGVSLTQMAWPVLKVAAGVGLLTSILTFVLFPMGNSRFQEIRAELGARPLKSEIKSRVFYEDIPDKILYDEEQVLQTSAWKGVFLADTSQQSEKRIILARSGEIVISSDNQRVQLNFDGGLSYEIDPSQPDKYRWSSFETLEVPVSVRGRANGLQRPIRPREKPLSELRRDIGFGTPEARRYALAELNRRVALPVAALLFGVLGVVLGTRHHRSGRAYGIVASLSIAFSYYALLEAGVQAAEDEVVPVIVGLWGPNLLLVLTGALGLMLTTHGNRFSNRIETSRAFQTAADFIRSIGRKVSQLYVLFVQGFRRLRRSPQTRPRIARVIDLYVFKLFLLQLGLTLSACLALFYLFTFFDLIDDIFGNEVEAAVVGEYFFFLLPHVLSLLVPISILIATLITLGLLEKTNQVVALKSCGISVYQIAVPVFALAVLICGFAYLNQEYFLPFANQRQDNLRSLIKGRPVQTHYTPDRNWIFGEGNRLYNYKNFDPERDRFAEVSIYELDIPSNRLLSHTYARQASWNRSSQDWELTNGWRLEFGSTDDRFETFESRGFSLPEKPDYFEQEVKESTKMTYVELSRYIQGLQKGGFEVDHLRTALYTKISFPLVPLIMALLGVPFAFTLGRKGALYGIAAGVLIGMVYWGAFGTFGVLGDTGLLAPVLAAWGPNIVFTAGGALLFLGVKT